MSHKAVVIGGGAAGMMAALTAAEQGHEVILLERNEKLGRKLYITGKGRCNVTNDCTQDEFLRQVPRNPRFLYSALSSFTPQDMLKLLEENGCPTVVQRGRRAFPASEKASDITRTLERMLRSRGVAVRFNSRVQSIERNAEGAADAVLLMTGERIQADAVVLATGGMSYPGTGSTGDGYRMARELGHTIVSPRASLSAAETAEEWPCKLQDLTLKNITLTLKQGKKTLYQELGELMFTGFGISGPLALEMSCHLPEELSQVQVLLDLKPGLKPEQLDARLQREAEDQPRRTLKAMLLTLLPSSLANVFPVLCGMDGNLVCAQMTREQREKLGSMMKALPIRIKGLRPVEEAIVTRGGISVKEVQPGTMESKLVPGLFFAGEILDVDAHTGGYNLQIAWSTGRLAGLSC